MMRFHHDDPRTGPGRPALTLLLAAAVLVDGFPAAAQRRRGEPEANPDFQQQLRAPGSGGGPLAEAEPGLRPEPVAEDEASSPRSVQGVQIGAAAPARATAERSVAPLDTRVTVRVKGAPLATFLDTISAQAKVNFIITEGLEAKRVTAFLQNVTVREALQVLLEIKGLTYQQIGKSNTYVVTPRSRQVENLITRIYTLNYIPLISLGSDTGSASLLAISAGGSPGGMSDPASNSSAGSGQGAGFGQGAGAGQGGNDAAGSVAIVRVLRSVLSRSGHVELEPRTNALVVTDIPEVFPQVEQIIAELDKKAPQVMIEAQIVEIDSNRSRELGFEWGGSNGELGSFKAGARDTTFPLNLPRSLGSAKFFDPLSPTGGIKSALGSEGGSGSSNTEGTDALIADTGIMLTSVLDLTALQITLRALVSRSEARFLGKPKILTLNNKSAVIQIGSSEAVALQSVQSTVGGNTASQTQGAERMPTGLVLSVTPQINREGYITMLVQPSFTDIQEAAISRASSRVFNPVQRAASTLVRVKNGQTLVMGGLLRSTETKVVRKVPFFGYIPIVGWLFTSTSNRRVNSDLVIFLTPTIVSD